MSSLFNASAWFSASATEADFERLYHAEQPRIYNFFRYRFGDGPIAEDLTSETFEKAWKHRGKYKRDLSAFSTWLFTIARRVSIDHLRKQHPEVSLDETREFLTDAVNMEDLAQRDADFQHLSHLLAHLADRERELVALKYGASLTNRTIAGLTGLSESNVAVILHRVLQSLKNEWENS